MSVHRALAPAKVNLGLFVGPRRERDGRHELVSVMQSISLADQVTLEDAAPGAPGDEVHCPGLAGAAGENLAALALRAFRAATGWRAGPQRLSIDKRIPLAAGLGGGSADAAATLRLARHASGLGDERLLLELASELGADVPAQVAPGRWLAGGAGELLEALPAPAAGLGVLVLAAAGGLSTAAVYAEADRLGGERTRSELEQRRAQLREALADGAALPGARELLHNDLQHAALSLHPQIAPTLEQARAAGCDLALVSGSGPTVVALFAPVAEPAAAPVAEVAVKRVAEAAVKPDAGAAVEPDAGALAPAQSAAARLAARVPAPICAAAVGAAYAAPVTL